MIQKLGKNDFWRVPLAALLLVSAAVLAACAPTDPAVKPGPTIEAQPSSLGAGASVLVANAGYVVGGFVGGAWADAASLYPMLKEEPCNVFGAAGFAGQRTGSPYDTGTPEASLAYFSLFTDEEKTGRAANPLVGVVGGEWLPAAPAARTENPTDNRLHQALKKFMEEQNMRPGEKADMKSAITADVDGDGKAESVLSATNLPDGELEEGKTYYSCVLVVDEGVATALANIVVDNYSAADSYVETIFCINAMDLNNDGRAEVILNGEGPESNWTDVWSSAGGAWQSVLYNSIGG